MSEHTSENVLVQKIAADTQSRIDEVQAHAKAEVADIERVTHQQVDALQAEAKTQLKKKQQQQELVAVSKARQAANIALQTAKRTAVDSAFTTAFTELAELSSAEYVAFFSKQAGHIVPKGSVVQKVSAPANRMDETKEIVKTISDSEVEINSVSSIKAGFILETTEGVFDVTLERLMGEKRSTLEIDVVNEVMS
jgi:vacuolar-type H+-ATPase subunit E/Vma4